MRIDKFLWFARISKTRAIARALAESGSIRLDGRRIEKASTPVKPGSVLTIVRHGHVRVLRVAALPARRGPPAEAALLLEAVVLDGASVGS